MRCRPRIDRAQRRSGRGRGRDHGLRQSRGRDRLEHRAADRHRAPAARSRVPGMTVNRFCSSGLQTIALAAQRIDDRRGRASTSPAASSRSRCVQNEMNKHHFEDEWLHRHKPEIYWPMLQTAEYVAKNYGIAREEQDRYGVQSQQRAAAARAAGKFNDEIVPIDDHDEGRRQDRPAPRPMQATSPPPRTKASAPTPPTRACRRSSRRIEGGVIAAGNASQFSDGAARVRRDERREARRAPRPEAARRLPRLRGRRLRAERDGHRSGVRGAEAAEARRQAASSDIDLWELNEAFAVQVIYCRDRLGHSRRPAQRQRRRDRASATPTA